MASDSRDVLARIDTEKERYLEELKDYIRIPSISTDPDFKDEVLRAGDFLVGKMREAGLQAELIDTAGHPLVYAEWLGAPGKPTVLFYGHYDVQPAEPLEPWLSPPFEPTVAAATSTPAAPPTTRGRCSPTSRPSRRCSPSAARCR